MTLEQTCMTDPNPYLAAQVEMQVRNATAPIKNRRPPPPAAASPTRTVRPCQRTATLSTHLYSTPTFDQVSAAAWSPTIVGSLCAVMGVVGMMVGFASGHKFSRKRMAAYYPVA